MTLTRASYLDHLNPQQRAAVEYIDGPELVIAGAGSGKTRVLTYKIVHLLANGYEPWRILALTFTNKAAAEMRERIINQLGETGARRIWMGTFHSIFARILRLHADRIGFSPNFTIYDAQDSKNLVKSIIKELNLDDKVYKPATIANIISSAKNALQSPEDYLADHEKAFQDNKGGRPLTGEIFRIYRDRLRTASAMDFDDLLYHTFVLLRDNGDICNHYNEYFRYVLVDEYQDTNYAQHQIITLLTRNNRKLCVVGDDAQSIYSFRGANLANILQLNRNFSDLRMFKLEQNFRSTENIINAAGSLIEKNKEQIPKNIFSKNGLGNRVEVIRCYSDFEEAGLLASRIAEVKALTGDSYEDFAVLYRTNAQSRILEESLRKRNIPYRIYGGLSFFQRKEVKDAVAYLRLAINPHDEEAIRRVINVPSRKIGDTTVRKVVAAAASNKISIYELLEHIDLYGPDVNKPTRARLEAFAGIVRYISEFAKNHNAAETLETVYARTGLVEQYASDKTPENISKHENLIEFYNYAAQFVNGKQELGEDDTLPSFMADVSLATDADKNEQSETDEESVTLMTIHAAKGLEFGNVFVVGVEKNLLPSMMSMSSIREIEEERRLLYVAITRAKRFCMLSFASSRYVNGTTTMTGPSPFLSDIDARYLKLAPGTNLSQGATSPSRSPSTTRISGYGRQLFGQNRSLNTSPKPDTGYRPEPRRTESPDGDIPSLHAPAELSSGDRIFHSRFQYGIITNVDAYNAQGPRITVEFDNEGTKTLLLRFARFVLLKQRPEY